MSSGNKNTAIKTVVGLLTALLILSGIGIVTGILPGAFYSSDDVRAARECQNCGVVETIKIATISDKRMMKADHNGKLIQSAQFVVTVRMANGEVLTFAQDAAPRFSSGERVKVESNTLVAGYF